jgi:hypothetical protein
MGGLQRDAVKLMSTTLAIVVLIVMIQNAGGFAEVVRTLFGGWNSTLATLLGRPAERI